MKAFKIKIDRQEVYGKFSGRCAYCGEEILIKEMQVEHVIPKANFNLWIQIGVKIPHFLSHLRMNQENHPDNLFPACRQCNYYKDTHDLETFRKNLSHTMTVLGRDYATYRLARKFKQITETPKPIIFHFETHDKYRKNPS